MKHFTATCFTVLFALALLNGMHGAAGDTTSCAGSTLCKFLAQSDCDAAMRQIVPTNTYFTGGAKGSTGTCFGHCGLFVQGVVCSLSGQQMIDDFNALRSAGCAKCGIYTYDNGCQFKADYVNGC